jgi:large subunit ribosomal protein L28
MSTRCMLTGVGPTFGKQVSHSHRRSSRRFDPNIQSKRYWVPSERRYVRLQLSTTAIKTIDRIGIDAAIARIRARGITL